MCSGPLRVGYAKKMTRWIVSFVVVLVLFGILYYLVRLRPIPEDDIKQRAHDEEHPVA